MTMQFQKWPIKFGFDWPFCPSNKFSLLLYTVTGLIILQISGMEGYVIGYFNNGVVKLFLTELGEEVIIHELMLVKVENAGKYEDGVCNTSVALLYTLFHI